MGNRIAVIDRDDSVRELVCRWLVGAGHTVDAYASPLAVGDVALVIADVASPRDARSGMTELLQSAAGVAVLLLSARFRKGQEGSVPLAEEFGVKGVLPKPFTKRQLLAAVTRALSREPQLRQTRTMSTSALKT